MKNRFIFFKINKELFDSKNINSVKDYQSFLIIINLEFIMYVEILLKKLNEHFLIQNYFKSTKTKKYDYEI